MTTSKKDYGDEMDKELFVEISIKFPNNDEKKKTILFKFPYDNEENLMTDIVAFSEIIKSWIITTISPED